ncbi:MAG: hypothetical protein ACK5UT_02855 [Acidobacteriota bacterium]|jgi:hypothetical protein
MSEVSEAMRVARPKSLLDRDAKEDLWRHTVSRIPTQFGKLQYLASLRDSNTGLYEHHGLTLLFGEKEAGRAMRLMHRQVFADWLNRALAAQEADLSEYLSGIGGPIEAVLAAWDLLEPWKQYIPGNVMAGEKALYSSDMRTLVSLLRCRYGVDARAQGALPPR